MSGERAYFLSLLLEADVSTLIAVGSDEVRPDALGPEVPGSSRTAAERGLCSSGCDTLGGIVRWMICCRDKDQDGEPTWRTFSSPGLLVIMGQYSVENLSYHPAFGPWHLLRRSAPTCWDKFCHLWSIVLQGHGQQRHPP